MTFLKDYEPVEERLRQFWGDHPNGRIWTDVIYREDGIFIFSAEAYRDAADKRPAATGWAREDTAQLPANMKASALEVCETSAIGRALANLGYAPRGKRPSREEMAASSSAATTSREKTGRTGSESLTKAAADTSERGGSGPIGGSAPSPPDAQTDLKPNNDDDIVSLLQKAVVVMGSTAKVTRYVHDNIDKDVRSEADLVEAHLMALLDTKLGVKS